MKDIDQYINEAIGSRPGDEAIEIMELGKYGYMYYDPNSGVVSTYAMDDYKDLVDDFGEDDKWAKKLEGLKVGQSLEHPSSAIYCRIW